MGYFRIANGLVFLSFFLHCQYLNTKDPNKTQLTFSLLNSATPAGLFLGEIDSALTPNCGIGSPAAATAGTTPGGQPTPAPTGTTGNTNNTRFTIFSQLVFKTAETLGIRFIYDLNQTQGPVDPQQGFTLTGGAFANTVTGNRGTVRWGNQGININPAVSGSQPLTFFQISIDLSGTYTPGVSTTTTPSSCNTIDGINCTAAASSTQCFTADNRTCLVNSSSSGTTALTIKGDLRCNSANVIQQ